MNNQRQPNLLDFLEFLEELEAKGIEVAIDEDDLEADEDDCGCCGCCEDDNDEITEAFRAAFEDVEPPTSLIEDTITTFLKRCVKEGRLPTTDEVQSISMLDAIQYKYSS